MRLPDQNRNLPEARPVTLNGAACRAGCGVPGLGRRVMADSVSESRNPRRVSLPLYLRSHPSVLPHIPRPHVIEQRSLLSRPRRSRSPSSDANTTLHRSRDPPLPNNHYLSLATTPAAVPDNQPVPAFHMLVRTDARSRHRSHFSSKRGDNGLSRTNTRLHGER